MENLGNTNLKNAQQAKPSRFVIRVRLRGSPKTNLYDPASFQLRVGDWVITETEEGPALGRVVSNKILDIQKNSCINFSIKTILTELIELYQLDKP